MERIGDYLDKTVLAKNVVADDEAEQAGNLTPGNHDWQIIEDDLLSQCGSSPRSLSAKDLESLKASTPEVGEVGSKGNQAEGIFPEGIEDVLERPALVLDRLDAAEEGTENQEMQKQGSEAAQSDSDESVDFQVSEGCSDVTAGCESSFGEAEGDSRAPDTHLSGHSSYANISLAESQRPASETANQELVDSLSASAISEMIAAADASSGSELGSDPETDVAIPDTGVFSIATGYPMETLLFRGQTPIVEGGPFTRLDYRPPRTGSFSGSESLSSTTVESSPQLQPDALEASRWRDWLKSKGNTRAAKFLHRIWYQLQVAARRAGACIPSNLRKRVTSILRCIDSHVSHGGRGSAYLAYGAAFVGFVLALRYYRECKKLRQLNLAQKDAFDLHVLKVLDLNEKLGRGMNIPITYNCGFKDLSFTTRSYTHRPVSFPHSFLTAVP